MLSKLFKLNKKNNQSGDIVLGFDVKTKKSVTMSLADRTMNTMIVGSIGNAIYANLCLPMINQDLDSMVSYINGYPHDLAPPGGNDSARYPMNGISIIDSSESLCERTLELVKAHGIPDAAITYINLLDPQTPSINPMHGPVHEVAEGVTEILIDLNLEREVLSHFELENRRNYLKHYIYLLKMHEPDKEVTLDMLLSMFKDAQLVEGMLEKLKDFLPPEIEDIEERVIRDFRNDAQSIAEWFAENKPNAHTGSDNHVVEMEAIRLLLTELSENPLIHRVLFGTSNFDFDLHMQRGGVLLCNTAKRELGTLSSVVGRFVLMNLQQASCRRISQGSLFYHHILVGDAPEYLYFSFRELTALSRKCKVVITTLHQSIKQIVTLFGKSYTSTLLATMRNIVVHGDISSYDLNYLPAMNGGDKGQEPFISTVQLVTGNKPMPVQQIRHNFLQKEDFIHSKHVANEEKAASWLHDRMIVGNMLQFKEKYASWLHDQMIIGNQRIITTQEDEKHGYL